MGGGDLQEHSALELADVDAPALGQRYVYLGLVLRCHAHRLPYHGTMRKRNLGLRSRTYRGTVHAMKKSELPDWIGKEIVIEAPTGRLSGADYGIVDDLTTYKRASRFSRLGSHVESPTGTLYRVRYTGCADSRDRIGRGFGFVPLSHLRPELANDHQAAYLEHKAASDAHRANLERERRAATQAAHFVVQELGIGSVHLHYGVPHVLFTVEQAQQLQRARV